MLIGNNRLIRRRVIVGLLLAASLTLLTLSFREGSGGVIGSIQRSALSITAPISGVVHRVTQPFVDGWNWTTGLVDARQENSHLKAELRQASANALKAAQDQKRIATLQELLDYKHSNTTSDYTPIGAAVVAQSPNLYKRTITINTGSSDGVHVNDPVIGPYSDGGALVGRVVSVTGSAAIVRLITDSESAVSAGLNDGSAKGILLPSDAGMLSLENVSPSESVRNDDVIVTTGYAGNTNLSSLFPRGILIGTVSSVSIDDGQTFQTIQVKPFVDFSDLTDVLVLEAKAGTK
jgi:rod shape-determining protein MreC